MMNNEVNFILAMSECNLDNVPSYSTTSFTNEEDNELFASKQKDEVMDTYIVSLGILCSQEVHII